jgi:hypothetical protein
LDTESITSSTLNQLKNDNNSPSVKSLVNGASSSNNGVNNSPLSNGLLNGASSSSNGVKTAPLINLDPDDIPKPTENGGFTHTAASRAKIGAANKGKTPWNKGKARSEEVKARIAEGVRRRNRENFLGKLKDMGLTEEEFEAKNREERRKRDADKRARRTAKGGYRPTEETRAKISKILKEKHANGEIKPRKFDPAKVRRGFTHTEETRAKISESLKKRWATDPAYREKMKVQVKKANTKEETRKKISNTLKKKWQDPEFRSQMMDKMSTRQSNFKATDEHKKKISDAMKAKWQDAEYREKTLNSIHKRSDAQRRNPSKQQRKKKYATKGSSTSMSMVEPRKVGDPAPVKKKRKRKKSIRIVESASEELVVKERKPLPKGVKKKLSTKNKAAKKKKKEPDGSVNRLREERRDLFDLLYGDEEFDNSGEEEAAPSSRQNNSANYDFGDEDLDSFDPYGLEDY